MGKDLISILMVLMLSLVACVTNEEQPPQMPEIAGPEQVSYQYEVGESVSEEDPLPNFQPIYVMNGQVSQLGKKKLGYKGWDFDKDGQIDMLQVLNDKGQMISTAYDFDGDGEIDMMSAGGKSYFEREKFSQMIPTLGK